MPSPHVTFHPLRSALAASEANELHVLIRVTPSAGPTRTARPPLNLALALDRSGSMAGPALHTAREAAKALARRLKPSDRLAVVTFDDTVQVLIPSTPVSDPEALCRSIDTIDEGGSTALFDGWAEAATQVSLHLQDGALNRVILLSDGQANVGLRNPDEIASHVRNLAERGVSTSTLGMGDHYDEVLLEAVSHAGDGNYAYIEHLHQLEPVLHAELSGLSATSGRLVSLGIEPNTREDVTLSDLLNDYAKTSTGRHKLPNLVGGVPIETVVKLRVPARAVPAPGASLGILRVRLAWTDPASGQRHSQRAQLDLPVVPASEAHALPEDPVVRDRVAALVIARSKNEAVRLIDAGDVRAARQRIAFAYDSTSAMAAPLAQTEIAELHALESALEGEQLAKARKLASSQAYNRQRSRE